MKYVEYKKSKMKVFPFLIIHFGMTLLFFAITVTICFKLHIKYYSPYFTNVLWTLFAFFVPVVVTLLAILLIFYFIFKRFYLSINVFKEMKELLGYLSVFFTIIINSVVKFYTPIEKEYEEKLFIIRMFEEFLEITLEEINYIYTFPVMLIISTISMYIFEKWNHAYRDLGRKRERERVNKVKVPYTPTMQRCDAILNDIREVVKQSRELLNK